MKQLHVVQSIATDFGGLGVAALRYAQAQAMSGAEVTLYVLDRRKPELPIVALHGNIEVVGGYNSRTINAWLLLKDYLANNGFDVIHLHGAWTPMLAFASFMASRKHIPFVVSPHGCLESWALNHRGWKKIIALNLYQKKIFSNASLLVATAKNELESIRRLGIKTPVALIPNGVDVPAPQNRKSSDFRRILFLSRIHPIKGLPDLISAWHKVRQPGWKIVIAGPDECGHIYDLKNKINELRLNDDFEFIGLVDGDRKEELFAEADFFVLPTYSENFGIAVAEALARKLPVITTTGAPWEDLETWHCGWWVPPGVEGLTAALSSAMGISDHERANMGERGLQLVTSKYCWAQIGRDAFDAYQWILGSHQKIPNFVDLK